MSSVPDEDLVLYYYRDGLEPARIDAIGSQLASDPELRARYEGLRADLDRATAVFAGDKPRPGFEDRVWRRFEAKRSAADAPRPARRGFHRDQRSSPRVGVRVVVVAAIALGVGLAIGRVSTPPRLELLVEVNAGRRVLGAQLVNHLETTERTLLLATRQPQDPELVRQLAESLLESHRLYALAADRAGRPDIADFLSGLEPVLLRLAHADPSAGPEDVQAAILRNDLSFKIRVVLASTRRDLLNATPETL